jgi:uncharacterized protein (DUF58 family)
MADSSFSLLDPKLIERARALRIVARRVAPGGRWAEQRSLDRGSGLEFRDYRAYAAGDDLRAIDWNVYKRLGRVVIRLFEELEDLPIYLVPDLSRSMWLEDPPRAHAALTAVVALAAIGLDQHDAVGIFPFGESLDIAVRPRSGRGLLMEIASTLEQQCLEMSKQRRETDLVSSLAQLRGLGLREGLVVIVSDFFDPAGADAVIRELKRLRHRLLLVPVVRAGDREPDVDGDLRLRDCETGSRYDVSVTSDVLDRYRAAYDRFMKSLRTFATSRRGGFLPIDADGDVLDQLASLFEGGRYEV